MSDARRRKLAVWVRTTSGVVDRWVVRKAESQVGVAVRDLVAISWADNWAEGSDIASWVFTKGERGGWSRVALLRYSGVRVVYRCLRHSRNPSQRETPVSHDGDFISSWCRCTFKGPQANL